MWFKSVMYHWIGLGCWVYILSITFMFLCRSGFRLPSLWLNIILQTLSVPFRPPGHSCLGICWHLGGLWQWWNKSIPVMGYHGGSAAWQDAWCLYLPSQTLSPQLHLVLCPRRLTCVDQINELPCPQLPVRFGSVSSGGRWKGERRMRSRYSFPCLYAWVLMACWLPPSAEGLSSCQLHTALPLDSVLGPQVLAVPF